MITTPKPRLSPLNDLTFLVELLVADPDTAAMVPLTTGAATTRIIATPEIDAAAADPTLVGTATCVTTGDDAGRWRVSYDAASLTPSLLAGLFVDATPYVLLAHEQGICRPIELQYEPFPLVTVQARLPARA